MEKKNKKYVLTYSIAIPVSSLCVFLLFNFFWKVGMLWSLFFALEMALISWCISRTVLHLVDKDNAPKTWQLNIYTYLVLAGWTVTLLSEKDWFISAALALMVGAAIMYLGVKYDDKDDNGIPDGLEKIAKVTKKIGTAIANNAVAVDVMSRKYKPYNDILNNQDDPTRPMCYHNGKALSINEAIEMGLNDEAQKAIDYVESLKKEKNE